jgi:hypothetical protein
VRSLTASAFTVTDSQGLSYTQRDTTLNDGGGGHFFAHFTADGAAAAADTVTVHGTPNGNFSFWIREIGGTSGFDTSKAQIQMGFASSVADAITSGLATPSVQPGMVSAFCQDIINNPPLPNAGSGFTSDTNAFGVSSLTEHIRYTSLAAIAGTFTNSTANSTNVYTFAALFKEVGASGAGPDYSLSLQPGQYNIEGQPATSDIGISLVPGIYTMQGQAVVLVGPSLPVFTASQKWRRKISSVR